MRRYKKTALASISTLAVLSATAAFAATTPYDLIRPTWPLKWDSTVFNDFDTTVTKKIGVLNIDKTPASFKAGALMPDTLDQAYLDAINSKISPIRVNQAGYLKSDKERQFYFVGAKATEFEVVDADGKSLSTKVTGTFTNSGTEVATEWTIVAGTDASSADQKRYSVNFSGPSGKIFVGNIPQSVPTDKRLRIKVGDEISSTFIVSDDVYTMAKDASLKFFGIQRSGNSESWLHGPSHTNDGGGTVVNNITEKEVSNAISPKAGDLQGGWYDCGDHLKESLTQSFALMSLAVMSASNPTKDVDHYAYNQAEFVKTDGVPDMLREAKHGADFFLRAFRVAKGVVDNMPVSIGRFGADHGWWGRPETQDYVTQERRGGPAERDIRLGELGSNVSAEIAAGLAILGKNYAQYDSVYADSCLMVAKKMYEFAKNLKLGKGKYDGDKSYVNNTSADGWGSDAYPAGNDASHDDLAVAAIALHYATYETTQKMDYLNDAAEDTTIGVEQEPGLGFFKGGWMALNRDGMRKSSRTTGWANSHTYALYAFYKMLLKDSTIAAKYGISDKARLTYIETIVSAMAINLAYIGSDGKSKIELPAGVSPFSFDGIWYTINNPSPWTYNNYLIGNIFDVFAYADVVKDIEKQGDALPNITKASLKTSEMFQFGINELNYLFGVNPWDVSLVYGVGDKNDAHPHHRAANPEGRKTPGQAYNYVCPTGSLWAGHEPKDTSIINNDGIMDWEHYTTSEPCLYATALLTSVLTIASNGGNDYYEKKCDGCKTDTPKPFGEDSVYATAYHYEFGGLEMFNIITYNGTLENLDSVTAYIYFEATEEEVESCKIIIDADLCQSFDIAGFSKPCSNDSIIKEIRAGDVLKLDETYDTKKKTYTWAKEIPIGEISIGNKIRLDFTTTSGIKIDGVCRTLRSASEINIFDSWSFTSHAAEKGAPAYAGAPEWSRDQGDYQEPPKDPYIVLRSKGKLLWGYGPAKTTDDRVNIVNVANVDRARMQLNGNKLFVQATAQGTKTLKIFDLLGNQLMEKTFNGTFDAISLARLPHRGTMIAKLSSNGKSLATLTFKVK